MTDIFHYSDYQGLPLKATFYPASKEASFTLLYFHGGGLIYGERDDLPSLYIEKLTKAGYNLLTFDYPLAPEASLKDIIASLEQGIKWYKNEYRQTLKLNTPNYCLFGRSAGGYLSLYLASLQRDQDLKGVISFYGYYALNDPSFNQPAPYYQKYPAIPFMTVYQLTQGRAKAQANLPERFPIYLSYRQTGQWIKQLLGKEDVVTYSLTGEQLKELPPTFLAASTDDQDVPFRISETMAQLIPQAQLFQVSGFPHDFDATEGPGVEVYGQLIHWLDHLV